MIETIDRLLREGKISNGQAHKLCDRVDAMKDESEINRIFRVAGIRRTK